MAALSSMVAAQATGQEGVQGQGQGREPGVGGDRAIEEIVVTATKRAVPLQLSLIHI